MRFNYANYLKELDDPSKGRHSHASVMAWTAEYYGNLMKEIGQKLEKEEAKLVQAMSIPQTMGTAIVVSLITSRINLLKEILGKE